QDAVAHARDGRGTARRRHAEAADDALARPAALTADPRERLTHRLQELRRLERFLHEGGVVAPGFELYHRIVVPGDDDDRHLGMLLPRLHDEVQPVEGAEAAVGDEESERTKPERRLGGAVGGRAD